MSISIHWLPTGRRQVIMKRRPKYIQHDGRHYSTLFTHKPNRLLYRCAPTGNLAYRNTADLFENRLGWCPDVSP